MAQFPSNTSASGIWNLKDVTTLSKGQNWPPNRAIPGVANNVTVALSASNRTTATWSYTTDTINTITVPLPDTVTLGDDVTVDGPPTETKVLGMATSYGVYYSTSSSIDTGDTFVSGNATTTTKASLSNNTTYYYRVAMINDLGTTLEASDRTFATGPLPVVATSISHAPTDDNAFTVSYTAGANSTSYGVYYSTSPNVDTGDTFVSGNSTTTAITGLVNEQQYYYRVAMIANSGTTLDVADSTFTTYVNGTAILVAGQTYNWTTGLDTYITVVAPNKTLSLYAHGGGSSGGGYWNYAGIAGKAGGETAASYACPGETLKVAVGGGGIVDDYEVSTQGTPAAYNSPGIGGGASAVIKEDGTPLIVSSGAGGPGSAWNGTPGQGGAGVDSTNSQGSGTSERINNGNNGGGSYYGHGGTSEGGGSQNASTYYDAVGSLGGSSLGNNSNVAAAITAGVTAGGGGKSAYGSGGDMYCDYYGIGGCGGGGYGGGGGALYPAGGGSGSAFKAAGLTPIAGALSSEGAAGTAPGSYGQKGGSGQDGAVRIVVAS